MAEEQSIFNNLETVKASVEKKITFVDSVASLTALVQNDVPEDPSEKLVKLLLSVIKRIATLLKTRHTSQQALGVCLKLFEVVMVRFGSTDFGKSVASIADECTLAFDAKVEAEDPLVVNNNRNDDNDDYKWRCDPFYRFPTFKINVPALVSEVENLPVVSYDDIPKYRVCWKCVVRMNKGEQVVLLPCGCKMHPTCARIYFAIKNYCGRCKWKGELLTGDPNYDWKIEKQREAMKEIEGCKNTADKWESFYGI